MFAVIAAIVIKNKRFRFLIIKLEQKKIGSISIQKSSRLHKNYLQKNYFTKRYISDAANKKAPTPKSAVEFLSTTCPGIAFSPIGCT